MRMLRSCRVTGLAFLGTLVCGAGVVELWDVAGGAVEPDSRSSRARCRLSRLSLPIAR